MEAVSSVTASAPVFTPPSVDVQSRATGAEVKVATPMPQGRGPIPAERPVTEHDVQKSVEQANQQIAQSNEKLSFSYEQKLGMFYVQVTDQGTGEVIREIPSKNFVQHRLAMQEMIGLILDKTG